MYSYFVYGLNIHCDFPLHGITSSVSAWYLRLYKHSQDGLIKLQRVLETCLNGFGLVF